jgi:hypothetical protein
VPNHRQCCTSCNTFNRSRSRWLKVIRSVSMGASAIHESGHFYIAQTGHFHFAATATVSDGGPVDLRGGAA